MHRFACIAAAVMCLAAPGAAQNVQPEEFVLDNGMQFLLLPRFEEPNAVYACWIAKVGSVNERPGITGISHFFEHMMFKGTTTIGTADVEADAEYMSREKAVADRLTELHHTEQYARFARGEIDDPWDAANDTEEMRRLRAELRALIEEHGEVILKNQFDQIYTAAGATGINAGTGNDSTMYFVSVPSNKIELWAWMESDRLDDSVFREFYSERDVIYEERRMSLESSPTGRLDEQFDAMFWQSSPYSWSVLGWASDIQSYSREQFDEYFNVYYRPNNLIGVIVGDFDPEAVKPVIAEYFGRLKRGRRTPPPVVTLEVEQTAEKRLAGECDCQPQVEVRYHTVPFGHRDSFALEIMSEILNGRTGRLYKSMVEGLEIAASAAAYQDSRKYAGAFSFRAEVKGDATPEDLEQAWYAELDRLRREPVTEHELEKVKNQVAANSYRRLQRNMFIMFQLAQYEAMGGWEHINESPARLMAVTAGDVMRVAGEYFDVTNRCVALYARRAGSEPEADDPLAGLPPQVRAQVEQTIARLIAYDDPEELRAVLAQMEPAIGQAPPEFRPAVEYMVNRVRQRLAELEAEDEK